MRHFSWESSWMLGSPVPVLVKGTILQTFQVFPPLWPHSANCILTMTHWRAVAVKDRCYTTPASATHMAHGTSGGVKGRSKASKIGHYFPVDEDVNTKKTIQDCIGGSNPAD